MASLGARTQSPASTFLPAAQATMDAELATLLFLEQTGAPKPTAVTTFRLSALTITIAKPVPAYAPSDSLGVLASSPALPFRHAARLTTTVEIV